MDAIPFKWIFYVVFFVIILNVPPVYSATCYAYYGYTFYTLYCSDSCCGSYAYYRYCCYYYYYGDAWNIGAIVGAVIGGLIGVAVLVVIFIVICAQCNKRTTRGSIVAPRTQTQTVTTISTNPATVGYSNPQPYVPPPQYPAGPSTYGTDPAYPPSDAMYPPPGPPQYTPQTNPPAYKY